MNSMGAAPPRPVTWMLALEILLNILWIIDVPATLLFANNAYFGVFASN